VNAPLLLETLIGPAEADQLTLVLGAEGVQGYIWEGAFGAMLIEVRDGTVYVNGDRVTPLFELRSKGSND
jgi:hypothetical protein